MNPSHNTDMADAGLVGSTTDGNVHETEKPSCGIMVGLPHLKTVRVQYLSFANQRTSVSREQRLRRSKRAARWESQVKSLSKSLELASPHETPVNTIA